MNISYQKAILFFAALCLPQIAQAQTSVRVDFGNSKAKPAKPELVGSLAKTLDTANIGKNYRKLKFLNKAVAINGRNRDYIIEGCKVRLWVFRNEGRVNPQYDGIIEAIEAEISPQCNYDFTRNYPSLAPNKSANEIIIKDILRPETEFYSTCFLECGEAKFQPVEFRYGLKQQDGYLAIDFIIDPANNEQTSQIANKLASDLKDEGAKISDDINCDEKRNKAATKAFWFQKITRIRFGMEDMDRDKLPSCKVEKDEPPPVPPPA